MKSWPVPDVPRLPDQGRVPRLYDTASAALKTAPDAGPASLYVCGITPYDATHLGHAATYIAFDVLQRVWLDAGLDVHYVQNITDIDDPLLERAEETGTNWRDLADEQIDLFRTDMAALRVLPPNDYIGAVESIPRVVDAVEELIDTGYAYRIDSGDVYYRVDAPITPEFGSIGRMDKKTMRELFAERGGDPDTEGKENPLDALIWRTARTGEPSWPGGALGAGRPGWHIECAVIALDYLQRPMTVQGGGEDLVFPHHEMCAAHATALTSQSFADTYVHAGMVGLDGEKMSKSLGNLVLVSSLRAEGTDPTAVRLLVLANHYRTNWSFTRDGLAAAETRLATWQDAVRRADVPAAGPVIEQVRERLADDLDTPGALDAIDRWAADTSGSSAEPESENRLMTTAIDALLGVRLQP